LKKGEDGVGLAVGIFTHHHQLAPFPLLAEFGEFALFAVSGPKIGEGDSVLGTEVGGKEGEAVGATDGVSEGDSVGLEDGEPVGSDDGEPDGEKEGKPVGAEVGILEGEKVGCGELPKIGETFGDRVGLLPHQNDDDLK
jgi:hypothetical protein